MKKLLLTTALILSLASCETKTQKIEDYRGDGHSIQYTIQSITHCDYKGHDYILFETGEGKWEVGGVVHDPDCRCKKNKEE